MSPEQLIKWNFLAENCFIAKYVTDCVRENCILPNLTDYRIKWAHYNIEIFSIFPRSRGVFTSSTNPLEVLLGRTTWAAVSAEEGERLPDIEDDDDLVAILLILPLI